jgi:NAD(P) transhydrogenase subunit alpha
MYILVLATYAGFEAITKVPPILHTPLMSGANAISGIALVGAVVVAGTESGIDQTVIGTFAVILGTINVIGGFLVTDRMLRMFRQRGQ